MSIDPLFEKYAGWSPYQYSMNNPVSFLDPSGLASYFNSEGGELGSDRNDDTKDDVYFVTEVEFDKVKKKATGLQYNTIKKRMKKELKK